MEEEGGATEEVVVKEVEGLGEMEDSEVVGVEGQVVVEGLAVEGLEVVVEDWEEVMEKVVEEKVEVEIVEEEVLGGVEEKGVKVVVEVMEVGVLVEVGAEVEMVEVKMGPGGVEGEMVGVMGV